MADVLFVSSGGSRDDDVPAVICLSPYLMQVSAISRALLDDARAFFFSGSRASSFLGLSRQRASRHSASKARQGSLPCLYTVLYLTMSESTEQAKLPSCKPAATHSPGPRPRWSSEQARPNCHETKSIFSGLRSSGLWPLWRFVKCFASPAQACYC